MVLQQTCLPQCSVQGHNNACASAWISLDTPQPVRTGWAWPLPQNLSKYRLLNFLKIYDSLLAVVVTARSELHFDIDPNPCEINIWLAT